MGSQLLQQFPTVVESVGPRAKLAKEGCGCGCEEESDGVRV